MPFLILALPQALGPKVTHLHSRAVQGLLFASGAQGNGTKDLNR